MDKNVIFCYSGTGNCLDLAQNIARGLGGADIVMMRSRPAVTDVREAERVGFVFPCYGGGAPEDVLRFAREIRVAPGAYTFAVSQSAAYMGTGLARLHEIIPLRYWRAVTHQCSCIWLFPHTLMLPRMSAQAAQQRSETLAREIARDVAAGKLSTKKPPRHSLNAAENAGFRRLIGAKARDFAVSDKCVGCGQCVKLCPRGNIRLENGRAVIGRDCAQCLGCLQFCPAEAISLGRITQKREHYHNPHVRPEDLWQSVFHVE